MCVSVAAFEDASEMPRQLDAPFVPGYSGQDVQSISTAMCGRSIGHVRLEHMAESWLPHAHPAFAQAPWMTFSRCTPRTRTDTLTQATPTDNKCIRERTFAFGILGCD